VRKNLEIAHKIDLYLEKTTFDILEVLVAYFGSKSKAKGWMDRERCTGEAFYSKKLSKTVARQ
jgi:hypothetical protein